VTDEGWEPFPGPQTEFFTRGEFEILLGGAAGPGKTDCIVMDAQRYAHVPGYRAIIFRRTFPRLQEIIDRTWRWYPQLGATYKTTEHRWYFPSGAVINLSHMQHEDSVYDHQGKEYHRVYFDELTQFSEKQYLYLFSRVRLAPLTVPKAIRSTTNPGGLGHMWVKARFVDVGPPRSTYIDPVTGFSRTFIPATVYDNPRIVQEDPGYIKLLEALPEIEKMRLLHGDWSSFEGQVFPELSQTVHGCAPFEIPPEWPKFMAFDWGYARPYCCLWCAVDFDGTLYIYRELYGSKDGANIGLRHSNDEICEHIRASEREKITYRVADPACWSPTMRKNQIIGPSFAEDATRHGLYFLKADNDRTRGLQQIHQRLQMDHETDANGETIREWPRMVIFNNLLHWWRNMTQLRHDEKDIEAVETDFQPDHHYDCTRYLCMSRPLTPKVKTDIPKGTFAYERRRLIRAANMRPGGASA
jgi:hypothetical protein